MNKSTHHMVVELGERLRRARLQENLSQQDLADKAGLSRSAVVNIENGKGKIETFVAILIALDLADHLDAFVPPPEISPIEYRKLKGKERKRAYRKKEDLDSSEDLEW